MNLLQQQASLATTAAPAAADDDDDDDDDGTSDADDGTSNEKRIPYMYIIDRVGDRANDRVFDEIAQMCIDVFFNEDQGQASLWKNFQLGYLRGIQSSDLRRRRTRPESRNEMLVARRVIPMDSPSVALSTPLILDWTRIINLEETTRSSNSNRRPPTTTTTKGLTMDYVRGEILGFCEVTERAYGLGDDDRPRRAQQGRSASFPAAAAAMAPSLRPILTNLSVKKDARQSGIGSQLVDACEAAVAQWADSSDETNNSNNNNNNAATEIILEVESDNNKALAFYKKRGYNEVFTDPACRRYTTQGFFLGKERCAKICMRKPLNGGASSSNDNDKTPSSMDLPKMLQSFRDNVLSYGKSSGLVTAAFHRTSSSSASNSS